MRGFAGSEMADRIAHVVGLTRLEGVQLQPVETLSKGFKRRVGLAQALLHDPPVLVLDEPTDGLDPNQKHEVRTLIAQMAPEKAIVISTHILEEVDAVCSRAIIIAGGRVIADETPAELQGRHPSGKAGRRIPSVDHGGRVMSADQRQHLRTVRRLGAAPKRIQHKGSGRATKGHRV